MQPHARLMGGSYEHHATELLCRGGRAALVFQGAEALHVSQPTVSHQIKALEDELGCALLVRSTRTVRLTDDDFAFLEYANDILDLAARAERRLKHKQRPSSQQLRIGAQYIRATYP